MLGATVVAFNVRAADEKKAVAPKPALTVTVTQPQTTELVQKLSANGSIAAWQEASIGAEITGLRLATVRVNVGDAVKRGQVLATFAPETVNADLAQINASVAEAEANAAEAEANAERARSLQTTGALSAQQINQYLTAAKTAKARVDAQRAAAKVQQLRLGHTQVLAPDNGVISSRSATVGAVVTGQELFRMIRQGRLEWRAEVSSSDLSRIQSGQRAAVMPADGAAINGTVRMIAPTVDTQTRNGLVYVDIPNTGAARAGMFARGEFDIGASAGLTLPQSAVQLRDGFSYVLKVGDDAKVSQLKVTTGRRVGDRIEIVKGVDANSRVVASGGGFLADGDTVRVVEAATAAVSPVVKK
ncbi:MAG: efflux RND transporter periplasmic adaptor subunit [Pseudomonadota bacterium]